MRLFIHLEEGEKGTPIELANAIIRTYTDIPENLRTDCEVVKRHEDLAELAEHIQVYLKYNRN